MKRALAERAKQSASIGGTSNSSEPSPPAYHGAQQPPPLPPQSNNIVSSPAPVPSSFPISHVKNSEIYQHPQSPSQPPKKIAKLDTTPPTNHNNDFDASRSLEPQQPKPDTAPSSLSNSVPGPSAPSLPSSSQSPVPPTLRPPPAVTSRSMSLGGAGHKRPREAPQADASSASSSSTNAFYLQHQNRALAVELRSLQHSLRLLERERDQRRKDCSGAVQALHRLQATWTQLETALLPPSSEAVAPRSLTSDGRNAGSNASNHDLTEATSVPMPSTGASDSVEWTIALSRALMALGKEEEGASDGQTDVSYDRIACSLASRASVLQDVLWKLFRDASNSAGGNHVDATAAAAAAARTEVADQQSKVQEAIGEIRGLQAQVEELKASRDAALASERKVRRNVYRLAANMINVDQLMAAIQDDTEVVDVELQQEIVKQQLLKQGQGTVPAGGSSNSSGDDGRQSGEAAHSADAEALAKHAHASAATIDAMKIRITDLERTLSNRDDSIEQLTKLVGEKEERISELSITQRSESDVTKLEALESLSKRVEVLESTKNGLEAKLAETRDSWAQARGDRDSAVQSLEDQHSKFNKRWAELVHGFAPGSAACENGDEDLGALLGVHAEAQAKEVVELQHKLSQALENVRQAESTRQALNDALTMNCSLQAKLDEIKAKYGALRNSANAAMQKGAAPVVPSAQNQSPATASADASSSDLAALSSAETPATQKEAHTKEALQSNNHGGASNSAPADSKQLEKLHREHRRMRKELSAAVASKETAKAKLEKIEKERDTLMESNFRLLKQMTEKDEMNAKSLSTILHLKSMSEELKKERDSLEQQAKSASQLALTARLASNAKDRVSEEFMKEKEALEMKVEDLESNLAESKRRLDTLSLEFAAASGKTSTLHSDLSNALNRCQELVGELEQKNAEIRTLTDTVSKSERETRDLTGKLQKLMKNPGGGAGGAVGGGESSSSTSGFTVDQLNTQISVLKGRLACPVCHYRDKECIIMRCRHMHCKQCVDERISNRSRKCPTCNNKFSDKDVEDVWLN